MTLPPLGLYVHLPWCERKCPYCDFNSHEAAELPEKAYVAALLADLDAELSLAAGRSVATIFIGGGTPSLFSAASIAKMLEGIARRLTLSPDPEITLEANPGSAEAARFRGYREAGVNRLSLGIQSFDDACLRALGRVHDSAQARRAIDLAGAAGFANFNIDLMHGLPGQDAAGARRDLATALDCGAPHLSWYQLTIEPNTVFYTRRPQLPVEDELATIQQHGEALLAGRGLAQYEVSAYARPGRQCRHNLNYWTFGDYLGIGAGAHGKITDTTGAVTRYHKTRLPADYLAADGSTRTAGRRTLGQDEIAGEFMLNALRLNAGFTLPAFTAATGLASDCIGAPLNSLAGRDLLIVDNGHVRTTELGRRFLDTVVAEFFA